MGWYTIEYFDETLPVVSPMLFRDKESALANACALLRAGFSVLKVTGPDFEMTGTALAAYNSARLRRKHRWAC